MVRGLAFFVPLLLLSCTASSSNPHEVTLEAGEVDRRATPVSITLDEASASDTNSVCITANNREQPGQIVASEDGRAEAWWIADVPVGESVTYSLEVGRDCSDGAFTWASSEGQSTVLHFEDRPVLEYVHPIYDADDLDETRKPFHHVFAPDGSRHITKGAGGLYSHHRGIFFGYNNISLNGDEVDIWHSNNGEHQQHQEVVETFSGPVFGGHTTRILWKDREGEPFIEELRTVRAFHQNENEWLMEFSSTLETLRGPIRLDGDRQHAGVQFRAAQDVADEPDHTRYIRPEAWTDLPPEEEYNGDDYLDLPWNAISYPLDGQPYTVAYMSSPENPEGAEFSERLYGRFGEFFPYDLSEDNPLHVDYRFWVVASDNVERDVIDEKYRDWTSPPTAGIAE